MTNPRSSLSEAANRLWEALHRHTGGFVLQVDDDGRLDLLDPMTGESEPVFWPSKKAEK